ncbi:hypothetical protein K1719_006963 [Acacia pycnantha]|nr:hypothetical protein K1719_006963 [Acacia pycnantha]
MADLTANNPPSPPQTQPWPIPLPIPPHQLSFTYMAQISPFFPRLGLDFFKRPSIFPPASPQGFSTPPPAAIDNYGAYRFAQSGCGVYGAGGPCFVGPYGYLYLPPIQLQLKAHWFDDLKVHGRESNRISPSQPRMVGLESRGTGVFHPPDLNHGARNKKRRKKRGNVTAWKRNEKNGGVEDRGEGSRRRSGELEEWAQSQADYDLLLPSEWPY